MKFDMNTVFTHYDGLTNYRLMLIKMNRLMYIKPVKPFDKMYRTLEICRTYDQMLIEQLWDDVP